MQAQRICQNKTLLITREEYTVSFQLRAGGEGNSELESISPLKSGS